MNTPSEQLLHRNHKTFTKSVQHTLKSPSSCTNVMSRVGTCGRLLRTAGSRPSEPSPEVLQNESGTPVRNSVHSKRHAALNFTPSATSWAPTCGSVEGPVREHWLLNSG